uniref:Uncharacterized protein n=1 Tax=Parascaris univalens TaxID=6257 RepID=A0A915ACM8_PARUN
MTLLMLLANKNVVLLNEWRASVVRTVPRFPSTDLFMPKLPASDDKCPLVCAPRSSRRFSALTGFYIFHFISIIHCQIATSSAFSLLVICSPHHYYRHTTVFPTEFPILYR